jgi:hypothetical protein
MRDRLINNIQQPELVNSNIQSWTNSYASKDSSKNFIINTSQKTLQEVIDMIQNQVLTSLVEPR